MGRGGSIYVATDPTNLPLEVGTPGAGVAIGPLGTLLYPGNTGAGSAITTSGNFTGTATSTVPYSSSLTINGGLAPFTASLATGALPNGMALSTAGNTVTLAGTDPAPETANFTYQITDALGKTFTSTTQTIVVS